MARTDLSLIFALIAGAGLLGATLWVTGALAKPPWMSVIKDASGKDIIMIGGKCYNETGSSVTCPTTSCPTGQTAVGGVCVPISCPTGQSLINGVCVTTPIQCPTGQTLLNGSCVPILCPAGTHLVGNACVNNTVTPPPPPTGWTDDFSTPASFVLADQQVSPNGKWKGEYNGFGVSQQANGVFRTQSKVSTNPTGAETHASLILSTQKFANFEMTFDMRTIQQLRQNYPAKNWETAWIFFRYFDNIHHYYLTIKNSGLEIGYKNNAPGNTFPEDQKYLLTDPHAPLVLGQWYHMKIQVVGYRIQAWENGIKVADVTENAAAGDPAKMASGYIGMYEEDSIAEFDNFVVTPLP